MKFAIVDGNYDVNRAANQGMDLVTADGTRTGGIHIFLNMLYNSKDHGNVICVFDGGHAKFRKALFQDYKRREVTTITKENQTIEELLYEMREAGFESTKEYKSIYEQWSIAETMKFTFDNLPEILTFMGIKSIKIPGEEADDIIALISQRLILAGHEVIIYSDDRDYLQLVAAGVQVYRPREKKTYNTEVFEDYYKFPPALFTVYRAFLGDSSDNIDGVKGIGEVTAAKIMNAIEWVDANTTDPLESFIDQLANIQVGGTITERIAKMVVDNLDVVRRNIQLMDFRYIQLRESSLEPLAEHLAKIHEPSPNKAAVQLDNLITTFKRYELKSHGKWLAHLS